jgi:putative hemolysin
MSSHPSLFKMVGLHYTPFSQAPIANTILPSQPTSKSREFDASMTNLGYANCPG